MVASRTSFAAVALTASLVAGCAIVVAGAFAWRGARATGPPWLLVALGFGLYVGGRAASPAPLPAALSASLDDDRDETVEAVVTTSPEPTDAGARLRVAVATLDGAPVARGATLALSIHDGLPELLPGDAVRFVARLRSVRGLSNPGVADAALQARAAGIDAQGGVKSTSALEPLGPPGQGQAARVAAMAGIPRFVLGALRLAARAHQALRASVVRDGGGAGGQAMSPPARLLLTAVLGERAGVAPGVEDGFRAAGATHVLSVSGLHLAAVALVFFAGLRRVLSAVPRLPLWIDPRRIAAALALPAIAFYTLLTGNAVATVRSALMLGTALVGIVVGRRASLLVGIAVAVMVLVAWSPLVVFDVSFQLSVVSVLALALGGASLVPARAGRDQPLARRALVAGGRLLAATVAAGTATAPLVAHHFGEITPAAPAGNLVLVPLVEMVVVPFGLAGAGASALGAGPLGTVLLSIATLGARLALAVAEWFRGAAPVWLTRAPNAFETAVWVAAAMVALSAVARSAPWRRLRWAAAAAMLALGIASIAARELARRFGSDLVVTFLDVGQGDAAVIQAPGGATILVDAGGAIDGTFDPGARVVEPFLRAQGITRLELVILSHPHPDHMGGLPRIFDRFPVAVLWTSGDDGHDPRYRALVDQARRRGAALPEPARLERGGLALVPLGPFVTDARGAERIGPPEGTTVNDASLVVRATFGGRALLLTGDLEANGEGELTGRRAVGQAVTADALKVPHHGSRTSSSAELLDAVQPRLAIMSLGWRNRFHFPNPEVLARYAARATRVLRTDRDGAVTLTIGSGGQMRISCMRGCP